MVALACAPLNFRRIVGRLQIISNGDDGQEDCRERRERDKLHCDRGKNGRGSRMAPANVPAAPKSDGDGHPTRLQSTSINLMNYTEAIFSIE